MLAEYRYCGGGGGGVDKPSTYPQVEVHKTTGPGWGGYNVLNTNIRPSSPSSSRILVTKDDIQPSSCSNELYPLHMMNTPPWMDGWNRWCWREVAYTVAAANKIRHGALGEVADRFKRRMRIGSWRGSGELAGYWGIRW